MKFSVRTKTIFFIVLGIIIICDFFAPRAHPVFSWDTIPGFWGLFGIVGCFLLIGVAIYFLTPFFSRPLMNTLYLALAAITIGYYCVVIGKKFLKKSTP